MPNDDDFSAAASALKDMQQECEVFVHRLEGAMGPNVLDGGELTRSVYESLKRTRAETLTMSTSIKMYVDECSRRKAEWKAAKKAKDDYEEELAGYKVLKAIWDGASGAELGGFDSATVAEEPVPPTPPPPPADYIDL